MYKVILYYLMALWLIAFGLSIFGLLPYAPANMLSSIFVILALSWATNTIFSKTYNVPANVESIYITAFILALIITPATKPSELIFIGWAAILAMASKYILTIKHKHLFNPAALAVAVTALTIGGSASWWLGTPIMAIFVLVGGLLVVRKILRADLTIAFFVSTIITISGFTLLAGKDLWHVLVQTILYSPILFFTFVMITEPLTTPPSKWLRIIYGSLVGFLFAPQVHFGGFYLSPEIALLIGNIFSYLVSPKARLTLTLKQIIDLTPDTKEFVFSADQFLKFNPGQYLEWTLGHMNPDLRGNRRYFTIASSPLEKGIIRLGVKFYPEGSSFKKSLLAMKVGDSLNASQLAGDFVMPRNKKKKMVFIAGGIGVTPFKAMIQYLVESGRNRDIVMIYANRGVKDIAYRNFFESAKGSNLGLKIVHVLANEENIPNDLTCYPGYINAEIIKKEIPDFRERTFFISGPHVMVSATEKVLTDLEIKNSHIKTDFFPGFA